jgi:hypothetical protein
MRRSEAQQKVPIFIMHLRYIDHYSHEYGRDFGDCLVRLWARSHVAFLGW